MLYFDSDYMRGACPEIMAKLNETDMEQTRGYGDDQYTQRAKELILEACGLPRGEVYFLVGGTQTNATVIDGLLRRHEGVVAVDSGHINVHEAGAIEAAGHKVLTIPSTTGKLDAEALRAYLKDFYSDETWTHMVTPGMVYITHSTEYGGLYTLAELTAISEVCHEYRLPLYMDGARLAYALGAPSSDLTLKDIARLCDIFYIGGTKCGALFGEAVVTSRPELLPHFFTLIKQHGALLAKGRLHGIQFSTLFTDGLYERLGRHAVEQALRMKQGFVAKGYETYLDSPTNQQFFRLPNELIDRLMPEASFELWGPRGEKSSLVRFVTDWGTPPSDIDALLELI